MKIILVVGISYGNNLSSRIHLIIISVVGIYIEIISVIEIYIKITLVAEFI